MRDLLARLMNLYKIRFYGLFDWRKFVMKCPNCGAEIGRKKSCEYCGTQITLDMQRTQEQLNKEGGPKSHSKNSPLKREHPEKTSGKK